MPPANQRPKTTKLNKHEKHELAADFARTLRDLHADEKLIKIAEQAAEKAAVEEEPKAP